MLVDCRLLSKYIIIMIPDSSKFGCSRSQNAGYRHVKKFRLGQQTTPMMDWESEHVSGAAAEQSVNRAAREQSGAVIGAPKN